MTSGTVRSSLEEDFATEYLKKKENAPNLRECEAEVFGLCTIFN